MVALQHEPAPGLGQTARMSLTIHANIGPAPTPRAISAAALRRALVCGARNVIADREGLNRINVYPVADGDTGSNLAFTLNAVLSGPLSRAQPHAGELMLAVGEHAIDGARGNSGAILAQFLQGVAEVVSDDARLAPARLGEAARAGSRSARAALSEPQEGTILSVIHAFAEALDGHQVGGSFEELRGWFERALARARQALANTPRQLPVLERAGVVDAGAKGFVDLLEGIGEFMRLGRASGRGTVLQAAQVGADEAGCFGHADDGDPEHRFCSECLVVGEDIDREGLRIAVAALGASSVVVAGSPARVRLHAHVDAPGALFEACARFGTVEGSKADDMLAQQAATRSARRVAIVTDSSADLPDGEAARLGIHVVPLRVNFGERDYLDKVGLSPAEFYGRLRSELALPRTSQPPPGDFRRQFEFLLSHHPAVVYVGLSRAVSGTLQSGETAAAQVDAARVRVVDTANAAAGHALLVMAAAERAAADATLHDVVAEVERLRPLTLTWAVARDISHAVRGGRVPAWARGPAELFGLAPIAHVVPEGRLKLKGAFFGTRRIPQRFARYVARRLDAGTRWRLVVGHGDCREDGEALLAALRERLDCAASWLVDTGPAVGAHAGPGTLVVSVQPDG